MEIRFYRLRDEYGFLSNFAPYPLTLNDKTWHTSEHYYQAQKFAGTEREEEIRLAKSPMIAARMGRSKKHPLRKDWESVKEDIMREVLLAKFRQHDDIRERLLATNDAVLIEHSYKDAYWGDGGDGRGRNRLGHLLMEVREQLREDEIDEQCTGCLSEASA